MSQLSIPIEHLRRALFEEFQAQVADGRVEPSELDGFRSADEWLAQNRERLDSDAAMGLERLMRQTRDRFNLLLEFMRSQIEVVPEERDHDGFRRRIEGLWEWFLKEASVLYASTKQGNTGGKSYVIHNTGVLNLESRLQGVKQSVSNMTSLALAAPRKEDLEKLIGELMFELRSIPSSHAQDAEVALEQAEELTKELETPKPRQSKLRVTAVGLVDAAKALGEVAPKLLDVARRVADLLVGPTA